VKPRIGITCSRESASWGVWQQVPAVLVSAFYVDKVRQAGGQPLLIPPQAGMTEDDAGEVLSMLDGLIIAGGVDVEPARYGAEPHPFIQPSRPDRDDAEITLARLANVEDLPILGVCRGMQVMAVAAGGRLEQHLPDRLGSTRHSPARGAYGSHEVDLITGSTLAAILGESITVPSYHHQGVVEHPGFEPSAYADDGVLEGFENRGKRFAVGVQWHPEVSDDVRLFHALVAAANGSAPQRCAGY
jgi:putative glutamine amidotransferase